MASDPRFFKVMFPVERSGVKKRWVRIGSATETSKGLACTIDAIPINWSGEFFIFASDEEVGDGKA